jgi:pantothenate kinase-related protein Tda10
MSDEIIVTVSGPTKSGKSAVAYSIFNMLKDSGLSLTYSLYDDNGVARIDEEPGLMEATAYKRFGERCSTGPHDQDQDHEHQEGVNRDGRS